MIKRITFVTILIFILSVATPVFATSVVGMKGLIKVPVADTPSEGKYGLNFQITAGTDGTLSFNYGISENFEVFGMLNTTTSNVDAGIKARVVRETKVQPSLSIGLKNRDLFVVASKTMDYKTNIRGHLGFGTGEFDGLFFGFNKLYNPVTISSRESALLIPVTNFKAEFLKNEINFGVDLLIHQHFVLNVGVINFRDFTYGIGYSSTF